MSKWKKISKRALLAFSLVGIMAIGLTGCGSGGDTADSGKNEPSANNSSEKGKDELKEFRIGVCGSDGSEIMELANLAYDKGLLEEELNAVGYTVKLVPLTTGGPEINEALAAGEINAAIYGDFPAFTSKSNGIDTTIVALVDSKMQYDVIAVDGINTPKDLEGKKVIVPVGTVAQYFWEHFAEANDIDTGKVEIINAASDATSLLQTGDADAYAINTYTASYYETLGLGHMLKSDAVVDGSTTFVFEVASSLLHDTPDLGTAINKALIRAYEAAVDKPEELYNSLASENISADAWKTAYSFDEKLSFLSPEITNEILAYYDKLNDWLYKNGIISEKVDVSSFVDATYYAKAKKALGE